VLDARGQQWAVGWWSDTAKQAFIALGRSGISEVNRLELAKGSEIWAMHFSSDDERLLVSGPGEVRIWKIASRELERTIPIPNRLTLGRFLDESHLVCDDRAQNVTVLLHLTTGNITRLKCSLSAVTHAALDSSGQRLAWATDNGWARVFSPSSGEPLTPPVFHGSPLTWISWSSDYSKIVMAGDSPEVRIWNAATGEQLLPALQLGHRSTRIANWSLDNRFIVSRSDDNTTRVWDAATGEAVTPMLQHRSFVIAANLVANNRLITVSRPDRIRAWDLDETKLPADLLGEYARLLSGRRLNSAGIMVPLKPDELAKLNRSLRQQAPGLFESH
jgi:WD40 repeat protein